MKNGKINCNRFVLGATASSLCLMIILAIVGGWINYSAIPYWDMWDGMLGFLLKIKNGDYSVWWEQHNEHRIVLARIIFLLDYKIFGDFDIFSIVSNYILIAAGAYVFYCYAKALEYDRKLSRSDYFSFVFTLLSWLFLWTQSDNFYWAFQSQFVMAQLLPLIALFFLAKTVRSDPVWYFLAACLCGVLAVGSMANGVLVFPFMFLYSLLFKLDRVKCGFLLFAAIFFPAVYFFQYHTPVIHGHLLAALLGQPKQFLCYVLMYLGSPFHYLLGKGVFGSVVAAVAGAIFVAISILMFYRQLASKVWSEFIFSLLFFIAYIGATAIGTAGGRLIFGVEQALSSRYTTPAIMAWAAFALAVGKTFSFDGKAGKKYLYGGLTFLTIAMLSFQIKALRPVNDILFVRQQAALSLALGINDVDYIHSLFSDADYTMNLAGKAARNGISVFSREPFFSMQASMGHPYAVNNTSKCIGAVDHVYTLNSAPDYIRFDGWIYSLSTKSVPERMVVVNNQGLVAGYAVIGMPRDDVQAQLGSTAHLSGFGGYIKKSLLTTTLSGVGINPQCRLALR